MYFYMKYGLDRVTQVQQYFQQLRGIEEYYREDGRAIALRLMYPDNKNKNKPRRAVAEIVQNHRGLKVRRRES